MSLTTEAEAAYAAVLAAEAAAADAERKALRQAATDAVRAVLVRPDGTSLTMSEAALSAVHTDLENGLVVYSDGQTQVAAQLRDRDGSPAWVVVLVEGSGSEWSRASDRVRDLADIGAARAAK